MPEFCELLKRTRYRGFFSTEIREYLYTYSPHSRPFLSLKYLRIRKICKKSRKTFKLNAGVLIGFMSQNPIMMNYYDTIPATVLELEFRLQEYQLYDGAV